MQSPEDASSTMIHTDAAMLREGSILSYYPILSSNE